MLVKENKEIQRLTQEHRGTEADERERILTNGGKIVNNRTGGYLAVTRALGDFNVKD